MCGIAGLLGEGLDREALLRLLRHRGPDHAGQFSAPGVWLGATRLRISDPTPAADQPFTDGELTLVFNGEIDNHAELRQKLPGPFRTRSDTEVILRGYRAWGEGVVERLAGMFAFALWDGKRLLLARDRLGIKPLWFVRKPFAFASEVRALLAAGVPGSLDAGQIAAYLSTGAVPEPRSLVRGIEALPPAHLLLVENGELRMRRYWSPPAEQKGAAGSIRERLQEAVRASLTADVPVALLLSGGVDSAALAALAPPNVRFFHLRQSGATSQRAQKAARGQPIEELEISPSEARSSLQEVLAAQDQPSPDGANVFLIARAIKQAGLKAAVSGLGGDELFLGYPRHRNFRRALHVPMVRQIVAPFIPYTDWRAHKLLDLADARGAVGRYDASRALFPTAAVEALCGRRWSRPDEPSAELSRLELGGYLVDTLLRDSDVQSMAHGVELRVPLLDHRLVEAVLSLPARVRQKSLLAEAAGVDPALAALPKEGFELPLERWLDVGEPPLPDLERVGLRPEAVNVIWSHFRRRRDRPTAHRVWGLVALVEWARRNRASL